MSNRTRIGSESGDKGREKKESQRCPRDCCIFRGGKSEMEESEGARGIYGRVYGNAEKGARDGVSA